MPITKTLLASGTALLLSAGLAAAAPATARSDLNVRSGPGTQYGVVGSIEAGETVDARDCSGGWCQVSFSGGSGYASSSYLSGGGGGGPSAGVVVSPGYAYGQGYAYDDDYYDSGYAYGPSVGFYAGPRRYGYRNGWRDGRPGGWAGRPGWNGPRTGNWQGRPGGNWQGRPGGGGGVRSSSGFSSPPIGTPQPGVGGGGGGPRVSAPVGMGGGGGGAAGAARGGIGGGGGGAIRSSGGYSSPPIGTPQR